MSSHDAFLNDGGQHIRGAVFLGIGLNYLLWGVQIAQSYYYYKSYRTTDRMWLKGAVGLLFIADVLQSVVASEFGWRVMLHSGSSDFLNQREGWAGNTVPFMDAFVASIVHVTYACKIWILLHPPYNYICTAIVLTLSSLQLVAGLGCTIFKFAIDLTFAEFGRIKHWMSIWPTSAAATDILIAIIMIWKLLASRTGIKRTDDIISKVIRQTIETGLATSLMQLTGIILYLIWPLKPYHMIFAISGPKVYSNSMLALLNSRRPRTEASNMCYFCQKTDHIIIEGTRTLQLPMTTMDSESTLPTN